jgi:hypothetical protein
MKILCPAFKIDAKYSFKILSQIVGGIDKENDPFFILEENEMTYIQAFWCDTGFIIEYQDSSISDHYSSGCSIPPELTLDIFKKYAKHDLSWKDSILFTRKPIKRDAITQFGYVIGYLVAIPISIGRRFLKGFNQTYNENR